MSEPRTRPQFTSRITTLLTMIGVAVGLGNVWRFPYMMGSYGGSAFLLVYLGFVVVFAWPALTAEWALGRATRAGTLGALTASFGPTGRLLAIFLILGLAVATAYYLVVIAYLFYSAGFSLVAGFRADNLDEYQRWLDCEPLQAVIGLLLIAALVWVIHSGLRRGIERISNLAVPFFGIVVLYLIFHALSLPGAATKLGEFLSPDFSTLRGTHVFAAMGQAFFSLSLGGTFHLVYASYLRDDENIPAVAAVTALGDVAAALLAAMFIVPAVLALELDLAHGPGLIFNTLPELFTRIPGGRVLAPLFLLALGMVAFLSAVAAFQALYGTLVEGFGWPRRRALLTVGFGEAALMIPVAFKPASIETLDLVFGSGMQVLGSGIAVVALMFGLGKVKALEQWFGDRRHAAVHGHALWVKWGVPAGLAVALGVYVWEQL